MRSSKAKLDVGCAVTDESRLRCNHVRVRSGIILRMSTEYIEARSGNYYVAETRISLDSIIHAFRRGESPETICQNFELLNLEQVYGAIAYYLAHKVEVDAYLMSQDEKWAEGKAKSDGIPTDLRERLMRAREEIQSTQLP